VAIAAKRIAHSVAGMAQMTAKPDIVYERAARDLDLDVLHHGRLLGTSRAEIDPDFFQPSRRSQPCGRRTISGS
jgi:hypothetical protein